MTSIIDNKEILKKYKKDINDCIFQFTDYILNYFNDLPKLFNKFLSFALEGKIEINNLRPIHWKMSLGILPIDLMTSLEDWVNITNTQRNQYQAKANVIKNKKSYLGNPLDSKDPNSEWSSFYQDKELMRIITLDINRTLQDNELFCLKYTKTILSNILLIWCKENTYVSYKQGMNEILAMLFYALFPYYNHNDIELSNEVFVDGVKYNKELYYFFHNEKYLEADLYLLFNEVMKGGIASLYEINTTSGNAASNNENNKLFKSPFENKPVIIANIITRGNHIINDILQSYDEELYVYLKKKGIDCTTVLQRWLKCMLSREFHPQDTCILWDSIFSLEKVNAIKGISTQFEFIDYISTAMILYIKTDLYDKEEHEILKRIFKYPPIESVVTLIKLAEKIQRRVSSMNPVNNKQISIKGEKKEVKGKDNNGNSKIKKTAFQSNYTEIPSSMTDYLVSNGTKNMDVVYQITTQITSQKNILLSKLEELKEKYVIDKESDDYLDFGFILNQLRKKMI